MKQELSLLEIPESIGALSYPDFVAFLRQKNTPPGGEATLREWVREAGITQGSHVLDLACTTGFSSRTAALLTGCSGEGIDISADAVKGAQEEASLVGKQESLKYRVADATDLPFGDAMFSHVLGGCNFSFIQDRRRALAEVRRVLKKSGQLCVASFYYDKAPTDEILAEVKRVVGFEPRAEWTRTFWDQFFGCELALSYERDHELPVVAESIVEAGVRQQIYGEMSALRNKSECVQKCAYERLLDTRLVLNRHREYQRCLVQAWRREA